MKNFFTSLLGALTALVIYSMGVVVLMVLFLVAMAALGEKKAAPLETGSYLVFDLSVDITDAPPPFDSSALAAMLGGKKKPGVLQLRQVTHALRRAAADSRIAGVFLLGELDRDGRGNGLATLKEVRAALEEFKAAGKPVLAYLEQGGTREALLASVADHLVIDPYGLVIMPGLASEQMFFAGALEKLGVGVQVTRVGKYKSAIEPLTRQSMSPENRAQLQELLDDLWNDLLGDIAAGRKLSPQDLQRLIDTEGILTSQSVLKNHIADRTLYRDEIIDELKVNTGRKGSDKPFKQISLENYIDLVRESGTGGPGASGKGKIAVIYAEGVIVDGDGEHGEVGGVSFARELRKLRQDESVKAIVLRVNSPGGSVFASENIQREVRLAKQVKPVIVSMGSLAASGGYWISAYADRIYAEPTTITGSIGVFGVQFDVQKMTSNLGISFDAVKTGRFADAQTIARPKTPEEMAIVQRLVDWYYDQFVTKVAEGRALERGAVEEIAQGRIWSGTEAVKLKLVDEVGGIDAAIAHAAEKAGLGKNYELVEFPREKQLGELIAEMLEGLKPMSARSDGVFSRMVENLRTEFARLEQFNDPQGVYARLPLEINLK